ncbi:MAG: hypothetical protein PHW52_02130 [Candidatus Pacebacteria bacterium]|nr:hypothetical protein [Candidatus Paceibacterota bacterium]
MKPIVPTKEDASLVLGNTVNVVHASRCGTCACKCACRYNNGDKEDPW